VNWRVARRIACSSHQGQHTRFGESVIEHLERVAAAVPPDSRAVAWLHDLFELVPCSPTQLRARGLSGMQEQVLALLTRDEAEPYETYVLRLVGATGRAGRIARTVKLADLDDHLAHARIPPDAPPYAWARDCVLERVGATALAAASA
jgi:hypothetical protein